MSQPALPTSLAARPEPGAQLLEAVRQRHSQHSLQLAQHWVHRRGVLDLQRFCRTQLASDLGAEAVAWLQELLALDTPQPGSGDAPPPIPRPIQAAAAPLGASTAASLSATSPALSVAPFDAPAEAAGMAPLKPELTPAQPAVAAEAAASAADVGAGPQLPAMPNLDRDLLLHARAVAAVDEAFAALAQSFQESSSTAASEPTEAALPLDLPTQTADAGVPMPEPLPARSGLWPNLRASAASLSWVLRPASPGPSPQAAERSNDPPTGPTAELPPIGIASTPDTPEQQDDPETPATLESVSLDEAATPAPPAADEDSPAETAAASQADTSEGGGQDSSAPEDANPVVAADAAEDSVGLLQRVRARMARGHRPRLSRLRAVMRDCLEETLALLRTPAPDPHEDDGGFEDSEPLAAELPAPEQPSPSWSLDLEALLPPSLTPPSVSEAAAPVGPRQDSGSTAEVPAPAAPAVTPAPSLKAVSASDTTPAAPSLTRPAQASQATAAVGGQPAPAPRPRPGLSASRAARGSDRPAPAPATLSDLRAWLPDRNDLPRAS